MSNKVNFQSRVHAYWQGLKKSAASYRERYGQGTVTVKGKTRKRGSQFSTDGTTGVGGERRRKAIDRVIGS